MAISNRKSFKRKHWNIIHRWKKNAHWLTLAWHKSVFVEQTGPTASQYCQMTCIAGENILYSEYIVTLMVDRCFVSSTTGSSDNSLSVLELPLCKMFRIIAAKFLRNMFSSWRHLKKKLIIKMHTSRFPLIEIHSFWHSNKMKTWWSKDRVNVQSK